MSLADYLGKKQVKGDVGIEVEVEGARLPDDDLCQERGKFWKAIPDGSLRNGMEYIYRGATPIDKVPESVEELNYLFAKANSKIEFSFRTSVHVHVNCLEMNYEQVKNFIYTYLILEPLLMEYCGEIRKGNRFCLRLIDAEGLMDTLTRMFQYREFADGLGQIRPDHNRYAALNVQSLTEHGTLEIRSMQGTADKDTIVTWANALVAIRDYAKGVVGGPMAIFQRIGRVGARQFVETVLGKEAKWFFYSGYENDVMRNISLSVELPYITPKVDEKVLPKAPKFKINPALPAMPDPDNPPIDWDEALRQARQREERMRVAHGQMRARIRARNNEPDDEVPF